VEEKPGQRGLSKEAWAAVGVIGAAVITGVVTLLAQMIGEPQQASVPNTGSAPITTSAVPTSDTAVLGAMLGKWEGTAEDSNGATFRITLEITESCAPNQLCGSIGVSHVPCYGQIFLENTGNGEVEFRVANFSKKSNLSVCQPGAGELFRPRPDGQLAYRTTYDPIAQGILKRI
jgi:hypothetical protein